MIISLRHFSSEFCRLGLAPVGIHSTMARVAADSGDESDDGNNELISPPPPPPSYDLCVNDATDWKPAETLTQNEALDALRDFAKNNCCWGEWPLKDMTTKTCEPTTAYKVSPKILI